MVQKRKLKKLKRKAGDSRKSVLVLLLILGLVTTVYLSSNARGFSAFLSGGDVPFTGDISFVGISIEGEEQRFSSVGQFTNNFDGVPVWSEYVKTPLMAVDPYDYPNLIGMPKFMPQTSWSFSEINHIDMALDNPQVIEEDTLPSTFTVVDGYYTEVYRYSTDIFVRVHANADVTDTGGLAISTDMYSLDFISGSYSWGFEGASSRYIGEYAPMYELYSKVGIKVDAVNASILETGADMAANGEPEIRFWPWSETPTWEVTSDEGWGLNEAYQYLLDNLNDGAILNNDLMQTGFDMSQGFNIIDKTEGADSYYEFNIGFNYLGVPGTYYNNGVWYLLGTKMGLEGLKLLDMEIKIPVTFQIAVSYDIETESMDDLFGLYPELLNPGASVHIIGTGAIPDNSTYGDYFPDNRVIGVFESLPGFEWLEGEVGTMAFVVIAVVIGFGIAMVFRRR